MDISLVIPLYNEEDSLSPLTDWIFQSLKDEKYNALDKLSLFSKV